MARRGISLAPGAGIEQPTGTPYTGAPTGGVFPLVGPLAGQPPASAGALAEGIATQERARQQDFNTGYMGSQLAPQWTGLLQGLVEAGGPVHGEAGDTFQPSASTFTSPYRLDTGAESTLVSRRPTIKRYPAITGLQQSYGT